MYQASRKFKNNSFSRSNRPSNGRYSGNFYRSRRPKKNLGESIDVSKFVNKAVENTVSDNVIESTFDDFNFTNQIAINLKNRGFNCPTLIQDKSIRYIMEGRDLIGLANTGTGKTAAFLLPLIHKCYLNKNQRVLIIAPTRELAQQIEDEFRKFSTGMGLYSITCVGGLPIYRQVKSLRQNPNFVIGTPGRLKDLKNRGEINFGRYENIVLDEIDRMLDMGFVEEIKSILSELPAKRQSLFFSATLPPKINDLVRNFLIDPVTVQAVTRVTAENIDQDIIKVQDHEKFDKLKDLLIDKKLSKVLIFSETKRQVDKLTADLAKDGFSADSIHGDKRQSQRQRVLDKFKKDELQILVATDVAARGLDIKNITHVINYTVPQTYDDYVHRIGRTGRGDNKGCALTFV